MQRERVGRPQGQPEGLTEGVVIPQVSVKSHKSEGLSQHTNGTH